MNIEAELQVLANRLDCALIWDRNRVALQRRLYDNEGKQIVRYKPDPVDFRLPEDQINSPKIC